MLGEYLTALLVAVFGYVYPVYLTFKALERHKRNPEAVRQWCMYWTVMGVYTVGVQIADRFIFFLPMYSEAKVAFVVCLWHPRTTWALYVYSSWLAPFLSKHEPEIDRRIDETRTGFGDVVVRHSNDVTAWAREKFAAALAALPQATPTGGGGGGGFAARNATEAAAMAYTRPKKQ